MALRAVPRSAANTLPLPWRFRGRDLASYFGLTDFTREFDQLAIGFGASYHLAVEAPEDTQLTWGRLTGVYADEELRDSVTVVIGEDGDNPVIDLHARRPRVAELAAAAQQVSKRSWFTGALVGGAEQSVAVPDPSGDPLDVARGYRSTNVRRSDRGFAEVRFRPSLASVLALTTVSALTAFALFVIRPDLATVEDQTMAAVVLALPIVAASFLSRPGEHAFAARLLRGFRVQTLIIGICALCVAAILGLGAIERATTGGLECRPARGGDAPRGRRVCRPLAPRPAIVPAHAQSVANGATAVAVALAVAMSAGCLRIAFGRRQRGSLESSR